MGGDELHEGDLQPEMESDDQAVLAAMDLEAHPLAIERPRLRVATLPNANFPRVGNRREKRSKTEKAARRRLVCNHLIFLIETGAGEGIRTLDPNLGKVPESHSLQYPRVC